MDDKNIKIVLTAKDETGPAFKSVGGSAGLLNKDVSGLAKTIAGATVAIGGMAVALGVSCVKSAIEAEKNVAQLNAVLKSTGQAAGLSADQILEQAAAFQQMTTYSDDAVLSTQNLLLTFTSIKGPVFQEATQAILDMSTALGQDLKSSAIQVGKALNDPINGVNALRRVGVNFTDDQQAMIQKMVESGKVMEAQKFILKELAVEFGGSAAAAADTFSGKMIQIQNAVDDMKESIGGAIIEAIMPFIQELSIWASRPDVQQKVKEIATVVGEFAAVVLPVAIETIRLWYEAWKSVVNILGEIIFRIDQAIERIKSFARAVADSPVGKGVGAVVNSVKSVVGAVTGARASGGPVGAGGNYLVGENGPEMFRPKVAGDIIPNGRFGGGASIVINITGNTLLDEFAGEKIAGQIMRSLKSNLRV